MRPTTLVAVVLLALTPMACSSGSGGGGDSGQLSAASFAGTWDVTAVRVATECDPTPSTTPINASFSIAVNSDSTATIDLGPFSVTLPIVEGRIQGYSSFNLTNYDLQLTSANAFTGTQTSGTLGTCDAVFQLTGTRSSTPTPTPATAQWAGSWDYVGTQSSTTCNPDPMFGTQTAAITITVNGSNATLDLGAFTIELPIVNGRIEGYSSFNLTAYDLELSSNDSFVGTQTSSLVGGCEVVFTVSGTRTGS